MNNREIETKIYEENKLRCSCCEDCGIKKIRRLYKCKYCGQLTCREHSAFAGKELGNKIIPNFLICDECCWTLEMDNE